MRQIRNKKMKDFTRNKEEQRERMYFISDVQGERREEKKNTANMR